VDVRDVKRRRDASLVVAFITCALAAAPARAQAPALSLAEVLSLQSQGVSSRQILRNAREYCIAFAVTDSVARQLSVAGADSSLVHGLRSACSSNPVPGPSKPAVPAPTKPAADVLFDDDFAHGGGRGGFAVNDRCVARTDSDGLRLENRARDAVCVTGYPSDLLDDNVRIEVTISHLGARKLGFVVLGFGRDPDLSGQYSISVTADRRVELCHTEGGRCQRLVYKGGISAVRTGAEDENLLAVEVRGRRLTLIVNEETVATYTANAVVTGGLSLGVGPGTSLIVSRVLARRLSSPPIGQ
jgi:hypothetical protein